MSAPNILDPLVIPLAGRHMIEASAGTGKTHNITRIYVRLLVEKKCSVQQILVMTFTDAATEEIKARIATFIDTLINDFDTKPCEFSIALQKSEGRQETLRCLQIAQLEIDLASIYTINGFCQRIIGRFGLSMSLPQNASLVTNFHKIQLAFVGDAIRALRSKPHDYLRLQNEKLHDPSAFLNSFGRVIGKTQPLVTHSALSIKNKMVEEFNQCWQTHEPIRKLLAAAIDTNRAIFYKGTKTTAPKNTDPLIDDAIAWLNLPTLIPTELTLEFVDKWLGIEGASKDDAKEADQVLINSSVKNLFSTARIKNYVANGVPQDHEMLALGSRILGDIKTVGVDAEAKKACRTSIALVPFYDVVHGIINSVNQKLWQHKQTFNVIGFDDQIQGVAHAMDNGGQALIENLQEEYPVALVDEFQDTDKHQYAILEHLFPAQNDERLLVMIGDPKQAIYSFRGGDIHTYMEAKNRADMSWGMDVNYRSSEAVINTYNRIFHGAKLQEEAVSLFDENIQYPIIRAPQEDLPTKLTLVDNDETQGNAAVSFVCANASRIINPNAKRKVKQETAKDIQIDEIMTWCAHEIKRLQSDVYIEKNQEQRLVTSEDIAILVRSHKQVSLVKKILSEHGIPCVFLGERSALFASQQALHVLWFLQAVNQPSRDNVRRAVSTGLVFFDVNKQVTAKELLLNDNHIQWEQVYTSINNYLLLWQQKGIHALLQNVIQQSSAPALEAERQLTNYLHVAELLAKASVTASSPLQLIYWLHQQITDLEHIEANELRLESDQTLVKIITQHKSKGLEYPIVFVPYANYINTTSPKHVAQYYDKQGTAVSELGVSSAAKDAIAKESLAEDMRLLYVSLTRPILRCYLGVFSSVSCNTSALSRALNLCVNKDEEDDDLGATTAHKLQQNLSDIRQDIFICIADKPLVINNIIPAKTVPALSVLSFSHILNRAWQVTSFSKLAQKFTQSANVIDTHQPDLYPDTKPYVLSDNNINDINELSFTRDEEGASVQISNNTQNDYRFTFEKGANAGNVLHDVLEIIDFSAPQVSQSLQSVNTRMLKQGDVNESALEKWFSEVFTCPLLPASSQNNVCLQDLTPAHTLKEAEFYFPIARLNLGAMTALINTYKESLSLQYELRAAPVTQLHKDTIEGAMHGYIDLIFERNGRYYVADYKSNYLGPHEQDYTEKAIAQDIMLHNYDIQYLIYSVALHRYLGVYLPDYDFETHFGGVCYLYLRGMFGPDSTGVNKSCAHSNNGVFFDKVDKRLLLTLDSLFSDPSTGETLTTSTSEGNSQ